MTIETESIAVIRKVIYDAYASFPTGGLTVGDLAYATDRNVLYRWSGSAWESITIYSGSGPAASIPPAGDLPEGSFYYETDTATVNQVQSGVWEVITGAAYTKGTYTGNGSDGRQITHGCGGIPELILVRCDTNGVTVHIGTFPGYCHYSSWAGTGYAVVASREPTSTVFYVGVTGDMIDSVNETGYNYTWIAFR